MDGVLRTDDDELLFMLHEKRYIVPEQRKRWVRYNNVRFIHQFQALGAAEIAIAIQQLK